LVAAPGVFAWTILAFEIHEGNGTYSFGCREAPFA
jgi:hypothetical protein